MAKDKEKRDKKETFKKITKNHSGNDKDNQNPDRTVVDNNLQSNSNPSRIFLTFILITMVSIGISRFVLFFGFKLLFGLYTPFFTVSGHSMSHIFSANDVVIMSNLISFADLKIGDVIVFKSPYNSSKIVMHRIIDRFQINNSNVRNYDNNITSVFSNNPDTLNSTITIVRTKGDANRFSIFGLDYPLRDQHRMGKIVYHIHNTDIWFSILQLPTVYLFTLSIISIIFVSIIYNTFKIVLIKRLRK